MQIICEGKPTNGASVLIVDTEGIISCVAPIISSRLLKILGMQCLTITENCSLKLSDY